MIAVVPLHELMSPNRKILQYLLITGGLGAVIITVIRADGDGDLVARDQAGQADVLLFF